MSGPGQGGFGAPTSLVGQSTRVSGEAPSAFASAKDKQNKRGGIVDDLQAGASLAQNDLDRNFQRES